MNNETRDTTPLLTVIARTDTVTQRAYLSIRQALMASSFPPGERLTIRGLARVLGISPTPAREALARLVAEGLVSVDDNRTVRIPLLTRAEVQELCDLRIALETLMGRAALPYLQKPGARAPLVRYLADHAAARKINDTHGCLEYNRQFHLAIYQESRMPTAIGIIESLWARIGPTQKLHDENDLVWEKGLANNREILDSIVANDADLLARKLEQDIEMGRKQLLALLATPAPRKKLKAPLLASQLPV